MELIDNVLLVHFQRLHTINMSLKEKNISCDDFSYLDMTAA